MPFQVDFILRRPGTGPDVGPEPSGQPRQEGAGHGDGELWTIDAGPPFIRLTNDQLNDQASRERAVEVLRHRITIERLMLMRFLQFVPIFPAIYRHTTNTLDGIDIRVWSFWSPIPGENLGRLAASFVPVLTNFGTHLQHQDDPAAYHLLPILIWLKQYGVLDGLAEGLLQGLRETHSQGLSPAHLIRQSQQLSPPSPPAAAPQ
jgi:hypothetical protein